MILEIEVQGAMKIKEQYPEAILLFITAPSIDVLKNRLIGRGTETAEVVEKRMRRAAEEAEALISMNSLSAMKKESLKIA